jgi:hypothetical protein
MDLLLQDTAILRHLRMDILHILIHILQALILIPLVPIPLLLVLLVQLQTNILGTQHLMATLLTKDRLLIIHRMVTILLILLMGMPDILLESLITRHLVLTVQVLNIFMAIHLQETTQTQCLVALFESIHTLGLALPESICQYLRQIRLQENI